ncbi:MAG: hypothetical protein OXC06_09395 [Acidimicrobiaceae bacterium]|nr:hypothetical protein [Acidimicrobiaceae bacterium]
MSTAVERGERDSAVGSGTTTGVVPVCDVVETGEQGRGASW